LEQVQPVSPTAAAAIDRIYLFIKKEHLKVIDMFFRIDVDGSGEIEPVEFVQALSKMGLQLTREELDAVVRELDADGDGTVELHEFM
jgi:Ca2+-binding EF-hand superfamily protein